jgi:serine/threonine-protein kinase HipA
MELQYDEHWMQSPAGRPLSLSLPFGFDNSPLKGPRVRNFFENLLPDSEQIRRRLATRFRTESLEAFDLLEAIGRDCVGAVQLLREDAVPEGFDRIEGTPLTPDEVARKLTRAVAANGPGRAQDDDDDDFRISLAGAQEKTAFLLHEGQWMVPHGATPTTHIFKLPLGLVGAKKADLTTSVENEWLCLQLLRAFGLPVPDSEILTFGDQKVLSVSRFDRRLHPSGHWIIRLPQEDFCQVLGNPPHLKYEVDGGPGMVDIAGYLRQSVRAEHDLETFLTTQILFWMLAAPDGHAKNFSIHLLPGGHFELTPLYDVMSIWPVEGNGGNQWSWFKAKMAMAVAGRNRHYLMKDIQRAHFNAMAARCYYGPNAEPIITRLIVETPKAVEKVSSLLPDGFPAKVSDRIFKRLQNSADRLEAMPTGL